MRPLSLRPSSILRSLDPALTNAKTDYDAHCTVGVVIAFAFVGRLQLAKTATTATPGGHAGPFWALLSVCLGARGSEMLSTLTIAFT